MPSYQANKLSDIEQNMEFFAQLFLHESIFFLSELSPRPCRRQSMPPNRRAPLSQRPQQHAKAADNPHGGARHDVFREMNSAYHAHGGYERIGHEQHASSQGAPGKPAHGNDCRREHMTARKRPPRRIFLDQRVDGKQLVRTRRVEACAKHAQADEACGGNAHARNKQRALREEQHRQQNGIEQIERGGERLVRGQQRTRKRGAGAKRRRNLFVLQCVHRRPPCFPSRAIVA